MFKAFDSARLTFTSRRDEAAIHGEVLLWCKSLGARETYEALDWLRARRGLAASSRLWGTDAYEWVGLFGPVQPDSIVEERATVLVAVDGQNVGITEIAMWWRPDERPDEAYAVLFGLGEQPELIRNAHHFTGAPPAPGTVSLMVTSGSITPHELVDSIQRESGTDVTTLAILQAGEWRTYINGAPAVVNASFPATLADLTPFFIRTRPASPDENHQ
jgi:hypothetical protein